MITAFLVWITIPLTYSITTFIKTVHEQPIKIKAARYIIWQYNRYNGRRSGDTGNVPNDLQTDADRSAAFRRGAADGSRAARPRRRASVSRANPSLRHALLAGDSARRNH